MTAGVVLTGRPAERGASIVRRGGMRLVVRWFGLLCLPLIAATVWSLGTTLTATGNTSLTERLIEWMRGHHMSAEVTSVERWYYSHHQPPTGGVLRQTIPTVAATAATTASPDQTATADTAAASAPAETVPMHRVPAAIAPFVATPLPGEGQWTPLGAAVNGEVAIQAAFLRPDAVHTSLLAAVVRIDQHLARFRLVPGRRVPGHGPWPDGNGVPASLMPRLLAGFNSGFRVGDAQGGFYEAGKTVGQLVDGAASLVVHQDGTVTVGQWGRDASLSPDVVAVRQNLSLIVDGGQLAAGLDDNTDRRWGRTVGNSILVWRSGVGIDANGNLLYAASDGLSAKSLAALLQRAGAVEAMELDINHPWVSFNVFQHRGGALVGTKLLRGMAKSADRYLSPDDRDFIAVLAVAGATVGSR